MMKKREAERKARKKALQPNRTYDEFTTKLEDLVDKSKSKNLLESILYNTWVKSKDKKRIEDIGSTRKNTITYHLEEGVKHLVESIASEYNDQWGKLMGKHKYGGSDGYKMLMKYMNNKFKEIDSQSDEQNARKVQLLIGIQGAFNRISGRKKKK